MREVPWDCQDMMGCRVKKENQDQLDPLEYRDQRALKVIGVMLAHRVPQDLQSLVPQDPQENQESLHYHRQ